MTSISVTAPTVASDLAPPINLLTHYKGVYEDAFHRLSDGDRVVPLPMYIRNSPVLPSTYTIRELKHILVYLGSVYRYAGDCTALFRSDLSADSDTVSWVILRARHFLTSFLSQPTVLGPQVAEAVSAQLFKHHHRSLPSSPESEVLHSHICSILSTFSSDDPTPRTLTPSPGVPYRAKYSIDTDRMEGWATLRGTSAEYGAFMLPTRGFYFSILPKMLAGFSALYASELRADGIRAADDPSDAGKEVLEFLRCNPILDFLCFISVFGGVLQAVSEYTNRMLHDALTTRFRVIFHKLGAYPSALLDSSEWDTNFSGLLRARMTRKSWEQLGASGMRDGIPSLDCAQGNVNMLSDFTSRIFCSLSLVRWEEFYAKYLHDYLIQHAGDPRCHPHAEALDSIHKWPREQYTRALKSDCFTIATDIVLDGTRPLYGITDSPTPHLGRILKANPQLVRYIDRAKQTFGERELCILNDYFLSMRYDVETSNAIINRRRDVSSKVQPSMLSSISGELIPQYTVCPTQDNLGVKYSYLTQTLDDADSRVDIYWKINLILYLQFRLQNTTEKEFFDDLAVKALHLVRKRHAGLTQQVIAFKRDYLGNTSLAEYLRSPNVEPNFAYYTETALMRGEGHDPGLTQAMRTYLDSSPAQKNIYNRLVSELEKVRTLQKYASEIYAEVYRDVLMEAIQAPKRIPECYANWTSYVGKELCTQDNTYDPLNESMRSEYFAFNRMWLSVVAVPEDTTDALAISKTRLERKTDVQVRTDLREKYGRPPLGKRPSYLFIEVPAVSPTDPPLFLIFIKRRDILYVHLTGGYMQELVKFSVKGVHDVAEKDYRITALPLLFLRSTFFVYNQDKIKLVCGSSVNAEYIKAACFIVPQVAKTKEMWRSLNTDESFREAHGSTIVTGVFGAKRFMAKYRDYVDLELRLLLQKHHNIPDAVESVPVPKRRRGRPPKVKDPLALVESKQLSHVKMPRRGALVGNKEQGVGVKFTEMERMHVQMFLRPRMTREAKLRLMELCGNKSFYTLEIFGLKLTEELLENGVYNVTCLPISAKTDVYKERLAKNIEKGLANGEIYSRGRTMEELILAYTEYPKRYVPPPIPDLD